MGEVIVGVLIVIGIVLSLSGPVALILSIISLNKAMRLEAKSRRQALAQQARPQYTPLPGSPAPTAHSKEEGIQPKPQEKPAAEPVSPQEPKAEPVRPQTQAPKPVAPPLMQVPPAAPQRTYAASASTETKAVSLEQRIGTQWVLIAGIISVLAGTAFFLKYAFEHNWLGPWVRVAIVFFAGAAALVTGEVTRRRGYESVAKGTAALGFALLYGAVFSAYRLYDLVGPIPAFSAAIVITAAAMTVAVKFDEVLMAFVSLLGGYLTPILVSSGQNLPIPLFSYVLVLSAGAMGCGYVRRWRAVNFTSFVGTYLLYAAWFFNFHTAEQNGVAVSWLLIFFAIYLLMPLLYGLIHHVAARKEDVCLCAVNGAAALGFLAAIYFQANRPVLAVYTAGLGLAYLAVKELFRRRVPEDRDLQVTLLIIGLAFVTAALPLYFTARYLICTWALEAVLLSAIGLYYRSKWTQGFAIIALLLSVGDLLGHLPLHDGRFRLALNPEFVTWLAVGGSVAVIHLLWRLLRVRNESRANGAERGILSQAFFLLAVGLLAGGCMLEWFEHCKWNLTEMQAAEPWFFRGAILIVSMVLMVLVIRPICPGGDLCVPCALMVSIAGGILTVFAMPRLYAGTFTPILNAGFGFCLLYAGSALTAGRLIGKRAEENRSFASVAEFMTAGSIALLWLLDSEQALLYWSCRNQFAGPILDWESKVVLSLAGVWAMSGAVLSFAGLWLKKAWAKAFGIGSLVLSVLALLYHIQYFHMGAFRPVFNPVFGVWMLVSAMLLVSHGLWRCWRDLPALERKAGADLLYAAGVIVAGLACGMEWYCHTDIHIGGAAGTALFLQGLMVLSAALVLLFTVRPVVPDGEVCRNIGRILPIAGLAAAVLLMRPMYADSFRLFANRPFALILLVTATVFAAGWFSRRDPIRDPANPFRWAGFFGLLAVIGLWMLLSEQVYFFWELKDEFSGPVDNWKFMAQMYLSILWAVYGAVCIVAGFWARARAVRYFALGLFALLLGKIFLIDTSTLRTEYRIAAFLVTGIVLVAVSYGYQYGKKKGFFEALTTQQDKQP